MSNFEYAEPAPSPARPTRFSSQDREAWLNDMRREAVEAACVVASNIHALKQVHRDIATFPDPADRAHLLQACSFQIENDFSDYALACDAFQAVAFLYDSIATLGDADQYRLASELTHQCCVRAVAAEEAALLSIFDVIRPLSPAGREGAMQGLLSGMPELYLPKAGRESLLRLARNHLAALRAHDPDAEPGDDSRAEAGH